MNVCESLTRKLVEPGIPYGHICIGTNHHHRLKDSLYLVLDPADRDSDFIIPMLQVR